MTKRPVINSHKAREKGKWAGQLSEAERLRLNIQQTKAIADLKSELTLLRSDIMHLIEEGEKWKAAALAERERCACVALTTTCPPFGRLDNPIAVLAHAIADAIREGEPCEIH